MDEKSLSISVVGLGKLGSPIAGCFASKGYQVIGVDQDPQTVETINQAISPIFEPGLQTLFDNLGGRLHATQDYGSAISGTDVTLIVVPTPSEPNGAFSNDAVLAACKTIGHSLTTKQTFHLVVVISTVMPGSTEGEIQSQLEKASGKCCGTDFGLCYAPTFVALGSVIRDFLNPDVILIGESDNHSGQLLEDFKLMHPLGRIGKPEEIGAAATFLASDEGAFVNGADFRVDGGLTIAPRIRLGSGSRSKE